MERSEAGSRRPGNFGKSAFLAAFALGMAALMGVIWWNQGKSDSEFRRVLLLEVTDIMIGEAEHLNLQSSDFELKDLIINRGREDEYANFTARLVVHRRPFCPLRGDASVQLQPSGSFESKIEGQLYLSDQHLIQILPNLFRQQWAVNRVEVAKRVSLFYPARDEAWPLNSAADINLAFDAALSGFRREDEVSILLFSARALRRQGRFEEARKLVDAAKDVQPAWEQIVKRENTLLTARSQE